VSEVGAPSTVSSDFGSTFELVARLLSPFDETDQHLSVFSETQPNSGETGHAAW
jgi:hypothetical protein